MTVYWKCLNCPEGGEGDSAAAKHATDSKHSTVTSGTTDIREWNRKGNE